MADAPCVGVVGPSGAGKTTLLERLVPALRERGLRVAVVKHASHGFLADRPGKDSHRLYEAGAEAVALVSKEQLATFVRRGAQAPSDPDFAAARAALPAGLDLVLVEGFSWEPIPRLVLVPPGRRPPVLDPAPDAAVLRVVPVPPHARSEKPHFAPALLEELVDVLASLVRHRRAAPRRALAPHRGWMADA